MIERCCDGQEEDQNCELYEGTGEGKKCEKRDGFREIGEDRYLESW